MMNIRLAGFLFFATIVSLAAAVVAAPRPARCVVASAGEATWQGPCRFEAERGGSFTVTPAQAGSFAGGIQVISLTILEPDVGDVRGLTRDGINSRWGAARRSTRDRACWVGSDFSLCVY